MTQISANGISLEYETFGESAHPTILLVMGLGAQLTLWDVDFCEQLAGEGYHVIRYDNRDAGLSTKFSDRGIPDMMKLLEALMTQQTPESPYSLADMAADGMALLDALDIDRAHVVGASMGGMIVQHMAFTYPQRVLSMTSIMSTTGNPELPQAEPEAMNGLISPAPDPSDMDAVVERGVSNWMIFSGPTYAKPRAQLEMDVLRDYHRCYFPEGIIRQMAAVLADGDRRERLGTVRCPSLVIHGDADPLVKIEGGRDTAAAIPGAEMMEMPQMGHTIPAALYDPIVSSIARHAGQAAAQAAE